MDLYLVDSHCHLNLLGHGSSAETQQTILRANREGVQFFLNVCVAIKDFPNILATAKSYPNVAASVGLHPNHQDEEITTAELVTLANDDKVIAIGETGLDYYRSTGEVEWQRDRFRQHIQAALAVKKPLIVHTRAAKEDTIAILREEQASNVGGVIHCFTEDWPFAKQALDLGFYISFSGIVTFKNAVAIQDAARQVPLNRLLIETDCPYLAPVPMRGKPNEPAYMRHTAEFLAKMHNVSLEDFAKQTTDNFFTLFKGTQKTHV